MQVPLHRHDTAQDHRGSLVDSRRKRKKMMRINITSVFVDDQHKALTFYTEVLGFVKKTEIPLGSAAWLTVVSPDAPDGTELLLEPDTHPAVRPFKQALVEDGIPAASFAVDDVQAEYDRLRRFGVRFTQEPVEAGSVWTAVLDVYLRQPEPARSRLVGSCWSSRAGPLEPKLPRLQAGSHPRLTSTEGSPHEAGSIALTRTPANAQRPTGRPLATECTRRTSPPSHCRGTPRKSHGPTHHAPRTSSSTAGCPSALDATSCL